jgi:hypothetical protein
MSPVVTQVVVDADLREKLHGLDRDIVFVDETGRRLGRFVPEAAPQFVHPPHGRRQYAPQTGEQFEDEEEGRSLADYWTDLGGGD